MRPRSLGRQLGIQDRIRAASKRNTVAEPQFAPQTVRSGKEYTRWRKARLNKEIE